MLLLFPSRSSAPRIFLKQAPSREHLGYTNERFCQSVQLHQLYLQTEYLLRDQFWHVVRVGCIFEVLHKGWNIVVVATRTAGSLGV